MALVYTIVGPNHLCSLFESYFTVFSMTRTFCHLTEKGQMKGVKKKKLKAKNFS